MAGPDQPDETPEQKRRSAVLKTLAAQPHETEAWGDLYVLYWPRVVATMYLRLDGDRHQAQDLGQDVFVRLARYVDFSQFEHRADFERYLMAMCRKLVAGSYRRSARMMPCAEGWHFITRHCRAQTSMSKQVAEFWEEIRPAYEKLRSDERRLFELLIQETGTNEIAEQMNISRLHVGVRIHRLRSKLMQLVAVKRDGKENPFKNIRRADPGQNIL